MNLKSMVPRDLVLVCGLAIRRARACVVVTTQGRPEEVKAQLMGLFRLGEVLEAREDGFAVTTLWQRQAEPGQMDQVKAVCQDYLKDKVWEASGAPRCLGTLSSAPGVAIYELRIQKK